MVKDTLKFRAVDCTVTILATVVYVVCVRGGEEGGVGRTRGE